MVACPRCGRVDDGTSYQCPACYAVLQPDLARTNRPPTRQAPYPGATPPPGVAPPPGATPPPGAAPQAPWPGGPPGPTPQNPYHAPTAQAWEPYAQPHRPIGMPEVPSYLVHSILCTLLCCLPFGIVGIVYAAKVGSLQAIGDWDGAMRASDSARMWCWISFGLGLVGTLLYFIFVFSVMSQPAPKF